MVDDLRTIDVVVVGETHGRREHQGREAFLIGALAERGRHPAVIMEMVSPEGEKIIADWRRDHPEDPGSLGVALDWARTGWPSFDFYRPVFEAAFFAKLPIIAADTIGSEAIEVPSPPTVVASWRETMRAAHCDLIDAKELETTVSRQIGRDRSMAENAMRGVRPDGAFVIVGAAHARRDRGIPLYLSGVTTTSVAIVDGKPGEKPDRLLPTSIDGRPPFEYVWVAPASESETACERLRRKGLIPARP